jgi:hypothetical protein
MKTRKSERNENITNNKNENCIIIASFPNISGLIYFRFRNPPSEISVASTDINTITYTEKNTNTIGVKPPTIEHTIVITINDEIRLSSGYSAGIYVFKQCSTELR